MEAAAKERVAESLKGCPKERKIRLSEVVAVFVTDWHKYVRASVKKREGDDLYCVWAIDYGVPMVVHASNIVNLPHAFTGMQLSKDKQHDKRVHTGGMENCLPAEKQFNIERESNDKQKLMNWSPQAIELVQKILNQAVKLEFEHVQDLSPMKKTHFFGRLMMQRPSDGEMINVMKILLEMNMAVLAEREFKSELTSIESLSQPIMFTAKNELLDTKTCVVPVKMVSITNTGFSSREIFENENESVIDENDDDLPIEDNEFFDDSASVMQPKLRYDPAEDEALEPVPENPKESHADRSCSNASQAKSKNNSLEAKSDNDVRNNNTSQTQQPKNANKKRDRKQKGKANSNVSSQNGQSQIEQQPPSNQQPLKQQQQQSQSQKQQSQQPQKQNQNQNQQQQLHHQQYHHRQSMPFDQSGAQQRAVNGEQNQSHSNFPHSPHPKPYPHAAAQNSYHAQNIRNSPDATYNSGCTEFEAIIGKPPPSRFFPPPPPFMGHHIPPPPLFGPIPPQRPYQINFKGMYGPPQPGSGPPRQPNMRNSFHDSPSKQTMHLMSMLNIQNHPNPNNNANQRGQNRMRNRNSGHQGRNNQSFDNAGKMNGNANHMQRDKVEVKPIDKDSSAPAPAPAKVNSEKSENGQTTNERVE